MLIVHGMGDQKPDFAADFIEDVSDRLDDLGYDPRLVAFKPVHWADITQPLQHEYLEKAWATGKLDALKIRRFVIGAFGDATAYQRIDAPENGTYLKIHDRVRKCVKELYEKDLKSAPVPLVVAAHSLGGHIMSQYIYDIQFKSSIAKSLQHLIPKQELSAFEKFQTHIGMLTFGCNIPLFTFAYETLKPIAFPGKGLTPAQAAVARWYNYFDADDVLGYPLKVLRGYEHVISEDIEVDVGGLFTDWNAASHSKYWDDSDFVKPVAKFLGTALDV